MAQETTRASNGSHKIVYIVADESEAAQLRSATQRQYPGLLGNVPNNQRQERVVISNYASVCCFLQMGAAWPGWGNDSVTFVCEVDIHYSAAFAILFLGVYLWSSTVNASGAQRLRVITLSGREVPEPSIIAAMRCVWPGPGTFSLLDLHSVRNTTTTVWKRAEWRGADMVTANADRAHKSLLLGAPAILVCRFEEYHQISAGLNEKKTEISPTSNCVGDVENLCHDPRRFGKADNRLIGLLYPGRLLLPVANDACIIVADYRQAPQLTHGRVIRKDVQITQREIDELEWTVYHERNKPNGAEIRLILPSGPRPDRDPPRRLENEQLLGFVAGVVMMFKDTSYNVHDILSCFVSNDESTLVALQHLETVQFLHGEPSLHTPPAPVLRSNLGRIFVNALPKSDFDFDSTWLLTIGIGYESSMQAKAAIIHMAAILQMGEHLLDRPTEVNVILAAQMKLDLGYFMAQVLRVDLPPQVLAKGWLWVALACMCHYNNMPVKPTDIVRLRFDAHELPIRCHIAELVSRRAQDLAKITGRPGVLNETHPLRLDTEDVDQISLLILNAWSRKLLLVDKTNEHGTEVIATDILARNCRDPSIVAHEHDFLYSPYLTTVSEDGWNGTYFVVPLGLTQAQSGQATGLKYDMSVVVPWKFVKKWRRSTGERVFQDLE